MNANLFNIAGIFDLKRWQLIQDDLSETTGLAIITVDYKGIPITKHSRRTNFCDIVRRNPETMKLCQKCDSRGGLEAVRINNPYIYLCHCHIVDVAIPIIISEKYIGAIMVGQALLQDDDDSAALEQIYVNSKSSTFALNPEIHKEYAKLPRFTLKQIQNIADLVWNISGYIIQESIIKHSIYTLYTKAVENSNGLNYFHNDLNLLSDINNEINQAIAKNNLQDIQLEPKQNVSNIIKPAIDYIYDNKHEMVSLNQMAKICHLSPSYFSRLFKKEFGENFSNFLSMYKISLAKKMLETTNIPVGQISDDLGYSDVGYFIKLFKKQEGITPNSYRKHFTDR